MIARTNLLVQNFITLNSELQREPVPSADNECLEPPNRKNKSRYCIDYLLEDSFEVEPCTLDELLGKIASSRENSKKFLRHCNTWLCKEGLEKGVRRRI